MDQQDEGNKVVQFYAHIAKDGRKQSVSEHGKGAADRAGTFAKPFGAEEQARLAALIHDLGKYTRGFQKRLLGGEKVDHATAGARICAQMGQPFAAFAVAGHHGGLPNGGGKGDPPESGTFWGRMKKSVEEPCDIWKTEITLPKLPPPTTFKDRPSEMFFTRMLYSCLVDADFLDTAEFMSAQPRQQYTSASIEELWTRLQRYVSGWFPPRNPLNTQRCVLLERCMEEGAAKAPGLFTLTVPTGGGKTVASLAFALAHARTHGLQRVIYVIPYTSIIEQTAQVFREILGEENVLEHHSNVLYDLEDEATPKTIRMAQATENWDMPVVVTTAVQFFESLYACKPSKCRKLHNIAGSVVIFDEAQMLPLSYLRPCVHAISQLVRYYHVSAVLCTATQPALDHLFQKFLREYPPVELCPKEIYHPEVFQRVTFQKAGHLSWETLATELNTREQVLCIVNTRKSAQTVFSLLHGEGCFHLSTLMYPAHRRAQLDEIRCRLKAGLPCRVISTSLVEAGVDVDFPAVFREEAGLDSIIQAAGRCNREGRRLPEESLVTVFQSEAKTPLLFSASVHAGREVLSRWEDISSSDAVSDYFNRLLDLKGEAEQDKQRILDTIQRELFPFRTVAEKFHLIDNPTRTVYIPLGKGAGAVDRFRAGEVNRMLFRELGQYGVEVYEPHFRSLDEAGALEVLEDGSAILLDTSLYSLQTGLSMTVDSGKALFN